MSRLFFVAISLLITGGCATSGAPAKREAPLKVAEAVKAAATSAGRENSPAAAGKSYRYFATNDPGAQLATRPQRRALQQAEEQAAALAAGDIVVDESNQFAGHARAHAKTSLAHGKVAKFADLDALITTLPTDEFMLAYEPRIDRDTLRVREEVRNVGVCAWIVATKREDDNDYHVMISNDSGGTVFNAEISGLPVGGSKATLRKLATVRNTFESFIESEGRKTGTYTGWGDPVPVYMEGSLFYDTEHRPGKVGPAFARPKTSWEIHPVSKLLFEPDEDLCRGAD